MEEIPTTPILGFRVPLRITIRDGVLRAEFDAYEHQIIDVSRCEQDGREDCHVRATRDLFSYVRPRITARGSPVTRLEYLFPEPLNRYVLCVLLQQRLCEVRVTDPVFDACTCGGVVYQDFRRAVTPLYDLAHARLDFDERLLTLHLPRQGRA